MRGGGARAGGDRGAERLHLEHDLDGERQNATVSTATATAATAAATATTGDSVTVSASTGASATTTTGNGGSAQNAGAGTSNACATGKVSVKLGERGRGLTHRGLVLLFTNTGSSTCTLTGYPGATVTNSGMSNFAPLRQRPALPDRLRGRRESPSPRSVSPPAARCPRCWSGTATSRPTARAERRELRRHGGRLPRDHPAQHDRRHQVRPAGRHVHGACRSTRSSPAARAARPADQGRMSADCTRTSARASIRAR
jgi:hypothetical protein